MRTDEDGLPLVHRVDKPSDPMIEARQGLDVLLAKGQAILSREARDRARRALEEESDAVRKRRIEQAIALAARFEWKPVAAVALFEQQECMNCGNKHTHFRGWAQRMEQKANPNIKRLVGAECLDRGLPLETEMLQGAAQVCITCLNHFVGTPAEASHTFVPNGRSYE